MRSGPTSKKILKRNLPSTLQCYYLGFFVFSSRRRAQTFHHSGGDQKRPALDQEEGETHLHQEDPLQAAADPDVAAQVQRARFPRRPGGGHHRRPHRHPPVVGLLQRGRASGRVRTVRVLPRVFRVHTAGQLQGRPRGAHGHPLAAHAPGDREQGARVRHPAVFLVRDRATHHGLLRLR